MKIRQEYWIWTLLTFLTLAVYWQARHFDFITFDDPEYVTDNRYVVTGLSSTNVAWAFSADSARSTSNWIPLTWLSLMLDVELFGTAPAVFHLTNILLHTLTVLALFAALHTMTAAIWPSAFVAAVFAVHPMHVESVAWISERKDVLSTFFGVLAIWCYGLSARRRQKRWYFGALVAFGLSMLSKHTLVTLPFLIMLLDYWPLRRLIDHAGQPADQYSGQVKHDDGDALPPGHDDDRHVNLRRLFLEKIPFLLITILFCAIAFWGQRSGGAMQSLEVISLSARFFNAINVYAIYIWKTVWPVNLSLFYPYPLHDQFVDAVVTGILLLLVTVFAFRARKRHPYLIVGWLWYLGTLVPVIGIVQIGSQRMADRYMYFPMIGLLVAVSWWAASWMSAQRWRKVALSSCAISIIVAYAGLAYRQVSLWRDSYTIYTHSLEVVESSMMHVNLGVVYAERQQFAAAIRHYHRALQIEPNKPVAHSNLGTALAGVGQLQKAAEQYQLAIYLDPNYADPYFNLGYVFATTRQYAKAADYYRRAIQFKPWKSVWHRDLAITLVNQHRTDESKPPKLLAEAGDHFQQAIALDSHDWRAHMGLGRLYMATNQPRSAIPHLRAVIAIEPEFDDAHQLLRQALAK